MRAAAATCCAPSPERPLREHPLLWGFLKEAREAASLPPRSSGGGHPPSAHGPGGDTAQPLPAR